VNATGIRARSAALDEGPPTVSRSPGRPRDERASEAILQAALDQLAREGYARMTMESVAAEAGVARATVYRRYRDKADLVTAAVAASIPTPTPPRLSTDPAGDLVTFLIEFDRRFTGHCAEVLGSLLGEADEPDGLALHRQRIIAPRMAYALGLAERARDLGQLAEDADLALAVQMLVGAVIARRVAGLASRPGWAERAVSSLWRGLAPSGNHRADNHRADNQVADQRRNRHD
jgi:AcrR family transcriptional regulator